MTTTGLSVVFAASLAIAKVENPAEKLVDKPAQSKRAEDLESFICKDLSDPSVLAIDIAPHLIKPLTPTHQSGEMGFCLKVSAIKTLSPR